MAQRIALAFPAATALGISALALVACAHRSDGPDLDKLRSDPQAFARAKRAALERCGPGPPPQACCVALMEQGDVLWASGDKTAAAHAYEHARDRCPRFAPIRRHAFLMKRSAAPPPAAAAVDVRLQVGMEVHLPTLRLAWYEAYLDGQTAIDQLLHTTVGEHEVLIELHLEPLARGEAPVRLDIVEPITVPVELAGKTAAGGGLDVTLRERPEGTITERVVIEAVPRPFTTEEKFLDDLKAGRLFAPARSTEAEGQPDAPGSYKLLDPASGQRQLLTPSRELLPADLKRESFFGLFKICVSPEGDVESVKAMKSPGQAREPFVIAAIQKWRYRPYQLGGKPVAFCYPARVAGGQE